MRSAGAFFWAMAFDKIKNPKKQRAGRAGNEKRWRGAGGAREDDASSDAPAEAATAPTATTAPGAAVALVDSEDVDAEHDATAPGNPGMRARSKHALHDPRCSPRPRARAAQTPQERR